MTQKLIDKIKSRGYWRINFQPLVFGQKIKTIGECKDLIQKNSVRLRGWDYPHFPQRVDDDTGTEPAAEYFAGWIDWNNHKEFWRMYKSGQFLHYIALREDWLEEDDWHHNLSKEIKPMTSLGVVGSVIYQMTEIFEFLSRITNAGIYDEGVSVSIILKNTKGRELWIEDGNRMPFIFPHKTGADNIEFAKQYSKDELISKPKELAIEAILLIFDSFGWDNPSMDVIRKDQENFLSGKY